MSGLFDERNTLASLLRYGELSTPKQAMTGPAPPAGGIDIVGIMMRTAQETGLAPRNALVDIVNALASPPPPQGVMLGVQNALLLASQPAGLAPPNTLLAMATGLAAPPMAPSTTLAGLAAGIATLPAPAPAVPHKWIHLTARMAKFLANMDITAKQREDGETAIEGIISCLNRRYYGHNSKTANGMLIGSWGKKTWVRPPRDVDLLYLLPAEVYYRFQERVGNRQSQLLQEVKGVLEVTNPKTRMRGDNQVVIVPFDSIPVEVALGFRCQDGSILVLNTEDGGSYRLSTVEAELAALVAADRACNCNATVLARMMKCWQRERNVPLKSFQIEQLAIEFITSWRFNLQGPMFYDWMIRDFLAYLITRANTTLIMPGTAERVELGNEWLTRALTAQRNALRACELEESNDEYLAGAYWQDLFGRLIPMGVS